jgi:hypothetical protein
MIALTPKSEMRHVETTLVWQVAQIIPIRCALSVLGSRYLLAGQISKKRHFDQSAETAG